MRRAAVDCAKALSVWRPSTSDGTGERDLRPQLLQCCERHVAIEDRAHVAQPTQLIVGTREIGVAFARERRIA
jgi:hypothetical protein